MRHILKTILFAIRQSAHTPFNSILCIAILAGGMAITLSMLRVYQIAYYCNLPYPDSDNMYVPRRENVRGSYDYAWPLETFRIFEKEQAVFSDMLVMFPDQVRFKQGDGNRAANAVYVSPNVTDFTGATPVAGRCFTEDDARPDAPGTVIIDESLWHELFGSDPDLSDKTLLVNGVPRSVIGVMPESFDGPYPMSRERLWMPFNLDTIKELTGWANIVYFVGRTNDGVSKEQATQQCNRLLESLAKQLPEENKNITGVYLDPVNKPRVDNSGNILIKVLLICSLLVLLMACAIASGLTLARYATRTQEIAVRSAMGAPRNRLVVQMVMEFLVLAVPAAMLGLLLYRFLGTTFLDYYFAKFYIPSFMQQSNQTGLILTSIPAMLVLVTIVSVIVPALRSSRTDLNQVLHESTRTGSSLRVSRLSSIVISWQVATACIVLCGGAMMGYYIHAVRNQNERYDPKQYLCASYSYDPVVHLDGQIKTRIVKEVVDEIEKNPEFSCAAVSNEFYSNNPDGDSHVWIEGKIYTSENDTPMVRKRIVSPGYFAATNTPILAGRDFTYADDAEHPAAIVTDAFARTYFGTIDVIGRKIQIYENAGYIPIVGVVPDVFNGKFFKPRKTGFFVPYGLEPWSDIVVFAKTRTSPVRMEQAIRDALNDVDGRLCVSDVLPMNELNARYSGNVFYEFVFAIFVIFSIAALVMAAAGLFGIISLSVNMRRLEMAIRMVLGEHPFGALILNMKKGLLCIGAGLVSGLLLTLLMRHFMHKYMGDMPENIWIYILVNVLLILVCAASILVPSIRAMFIKPAEAFREG